MLIQPLPHNSKKTPNSRFLERFTIDAYKIVYHIFFDTHAQSDDGMRKREKHDINTIEIGE